MHLTDIIAPFAAFFSSWLVSLLIVATRGLHGRLTSDSPQGVQKIHRHRVPRVGGIAIASGIISGGALAAVDSHLWWLFAVACLPAFIVGLWEDLTSGVGVRVRLIATIFAGCCFALASGYSLSHLDLWPVDLILAFPIVAILFTGFAMGGIANAMNLIDGCNGLASGTALIVLAALTAISVQVGDMRMTMICMVVAGSVTGFFVVNFPQGRIFLGDGGAYSIGFVLAAIAVALPARNPSISPVIGLLVLIYPVSETLYSVVRRLGRNAVGQPDRLHLHSLVFRAMGNRVARPESRNSASGVLVLVLPLTSAFMAVSLAHGSTAVVLIAAAANVALYRVAYALATWAARTVEASPRRRRAAYQVPTEG